MKSYRLSLIFGYWDFFSARVWGCHEIWVNTYLESLNLYLVLSEITKMLMKASLPPDAEFQPRQVNHA